MLDVTRRRFLIAAAATLAMPAIVRASSLMPVRPLPVTEDWLAELRAAAVYRRFMVVLPPGALRLDFFFVDNVPLGGSFDFRVKRLARDGAHG